MTAQASHSGCLGKVLELIIDTASPATARVKIHRRMISAIVTLL